MGESGRVREGQAEEWVGKLRTICVPSAINPEDVINEHAPLLGYSLLLSSLRANEHAYSPLLPTVFPLAAPRLSKRTSNTCADIPRSNIQRVLDTPDTRWDWDRWAASSASSAFVAPPLERVITDCAAAAFPYVAAPENCAKAAWDLCFWKRLPR